MGKFRTDDDYTSTDYNDYSTDFDYQNYDNPEVGDYPGGYGSVKKENVFSRILGALGNSAKGAGLKKGFTLEKAMFVLYIIAMILIVFNFTKVMDFLFYSTVSILSYLIIALVVILLVFIFCRYILHIR